MNAALRAAIAVLFVLHGVVHWIGFAVPWKLMSSESFTYTTSAAWGNLEIGETGTRLVGVAMLVAIVPFLVAAYGVWRRETWAVPITILAAGYSLILCILDSPAAIIGVALDVAILAAVVAYGMGFRLGTTAPRGRLG